VYSGDFKDGKANGRIRFLSHDGDVSFGGSKDGGFHGKVTNISFNGDIFSGEYVMERKEGKGVKFNSNGDMMVGTYKNNEVEGKGMFFFSNGNVVLTEFKNKISRKGYFLYPDKSNRTLSIVICEIKNGVRKGECLYVYESGVIDSGYYDENIFCGKRINY
jgi:1-phosphatidylinositol-4-phosphate 5-kinase